MSTHENKFPLKILQFCILTFHFSWVNHTDICFSMQKIYNYLQKIPYLKISKNWQDKKYRWKPIWHVKLRTRLHCVIYKRQTEFTFWSSKFKWFILKDITFIVGKKVEVNLRLFDIFQRNMVFIFLWESWESHRAEWALKQNW